MRDASNAPRNIDSASSQPAISARILRKILLVIIPCLEESATEITALHQRCWRIGRLPVDDASMPAADLRANVGRRRALDAWNRTRVPDRAVQTRSRLSIETPPPARTRIV